MSTPRFFKQLLVLVLLAAGVYLAGNGRTALFDCDEGWYAEISREMVLTDNWVVPKYLGEVFPGKPPFAYWCQAACISIFGTNEFAVRLPSVLASAVLLMILGVSIGYTVGFQRAIWTVVILGTSGLFLGLSKMCLVDCVLLLWITCAQLCLYAVYRDRGGWIAVILFWIFTGLAILTKGPAVLGYDLGTLAALAVLDVGSRWRSLWAWIGAVGWWRRTQPLIGIAIAAAMFGAWGYLVIRREPAFFRITVGHNWIEPIFVSPIEDHPSLPGFYLLVIWLFWMPWSLFLIGAIGGGWHNRRLAPIRFAFAAVLGPWIVLETVRQKLPHYLLPMFPALAFLTADWLVRRIRTRPSPVNLRLARPMNIAWALGIVALTLLPLISAWPPFQFTELPWFGLIIMALMGLACAAVGYWLLEKARFAFAAATIAISTSIVTVVLFCFVMPGFNFFRASHLAADFLKQQGAIHPGDAIMLGDRFEGYAPPSLAFYQGGTIDDPLVRSTAIPSSADLFTFLNTTPISKWPPWIVTSQAIYRELPPTRRGVLQLQATFRGLDEGRSDTIVNVVVLHKVRDRLANGHHQLGGVQRREFK
jgi:4-amino-4-deoxy-L-arabinose transferase-like glycosyltransferase